MLKQRLIAFLKQGLTPQELALCVALGCVISVIPMLGTTTLLCALVAGVMRLNQAAIQSVNWVMYPLQFILLIPWYKLGAILFREPPIRLTGQQVKDIIAAGWLQAIQLLWTTTWHAVIAWALVAVPVAFLIFLLLRPTFRKTVLEK